MSSNPPHASIVIPTRHRARELVSLVTSALAQTVPVEILVMDDADSNATNRMIRRRFPAVSYHSLGAGLGPAFQRNRGIELSSCNFVFPVDDDTLFISPRTVEQTLAEFDDPRVGAVAIPYVNVRQDQIVRQFSPDASGVYAAHAFVGAAHALRRDVFLALGGFREHFFYMGEEGDYCLRMLNAGYITRLGSADPIHHLESPRRNMRLADRCGRRNDVLFAWHNVPTPYLSAHMLATTLNGLRLGITLNRPIRMLLGLLAGYGAVFKRANQRRPVAKDIYRLHRELKKGGPKRLDLIEHRLTQCSILTSKYSGEGEGARAQSRNLPQGGET